MIQVLQQESAPHYYLKTTTGSTTWAINSIIEDTASKIQAGSAGTACPTSPSSSVNKRFGQNNWQYSDNNGWHDGEIVVTCETPNRCL